MHSFIGYSVNIKIPIVNIYVKYQVIAYLFVFIPIYITLF